MRRQSIVLPGRRLLWPWEFVYRGDCLEVREFERALSLEVTYFFFFLTFTFWLRIFRGLDPVCPRRVHFSIRPNWLQRAGNQHATSVRESMDRASVTNRYPSCYHLRSLVLLSEPEMEAAVRILLHPP